MAELLVEWGLERALVHGGQSSVVALEPPTGREGWPVTFSSPWPGGERVLVRLDLRRRALSASGTRKGDHIVDPRTSRAAGRRAVWVGVSIAGVLEGPADDAASGQPRGSAAAVAEGFSTAFMVLEPGVIEETCRHFPGLEAWIATEPTEVEDPSSCLLRFPSSKSLAG
jgi:thiamine biosynthesis lipoprotein ApbE